MNIKRLLVDSVTVFAVALIVCGIVTLLWNLIVHGESTLDWATSFRSAFRDYYPMDRNTKNQVQQVRHSLTQGRRVADFTIRPACWRDRVPTRALKRKQRQETLLQAQPDLRHFSMFPGWCVVARDTIACLAGAQI
jgi:hypothetical protein